MLGSFDVVSLFTKIPVDPANKVATNRLRYNDSLWQRKYLRLEDITNLLSFCPVSPSFWKPFVDDAIYAVSENEIVVLLQHLNLIEPSIQLTVEHETDGKLPFVQRTTDGELETVVYRKPTHTDKYLSFNSRHPRSNKKSVVRTLF